MRNKLDRAGFFKKYAASAQRAAQGSGIFPATVLSAAALESDNGNSQLSAIHNNFFGIKAFSGWTGAIVTLPTVEEDSAGNKQTVQAAFCAFPTPSDGFAAYIAFLKRYPRYKPVFAAKTPKDQFAALQKAGYATDHNYSAKLTGVFADLQGWMGQNPQAGGFAAIALMVFLFYFAFKN